MKIREWGRLGEGEVYLKGVYQSGHSLLFHSPPALSPHFLATIVLSFSNVKQILSSPGLLSFMIPHVCCGESRLSSGPSLVPCFPSSGHTAALLNPQMPSWLRAFEHDTPPTKSMLAFLLCPPANGPASQVLAPWCGGVAPPTLCLATPSMRMFRSHVCHS